MATIQAFVKKMDELEKSGFDYDGYFHDGKTARLRILKKPRKTKSKAARSLCGAMCRTGEPCKAKVVMNPDGKLKRRCRMHGGLSTGPKTKEGREAIAAANRVRKEKRDANRNELIERGQEMLRILDAEAKAKSGASEKL